MAVIEQTITLQPVQPVAPLLNITQPAVSRLVSMMKEREIADYGLRVFVSGGGCSGLQYGMTFDNEERPGDMTWNAFGLKLIIDPISAGYLQGAEISYQQDNMMAGAFKIDNPNAASGCGCGHSFKPKNEQAAADYEGYDNGYSGGGCGHCGNGH
jgi:iron-sulfur cluster assembly accessory protein